VESLISHLGGAEYAYPQAEGSDDSLGAFAMYLIHDILLLTGIVPDTKNKKVNADGW
jgi:5-methylcytosine-specific restriction endonuclease McrBC regulatory subunit McrC